MDVTIHRRKWFMSAPDLEQSLTPAIADHERAAAYFWSYMVDRSVRFLPERLAPVFFSTLVELIAHGADPAAYRAGLVVLGRLYRRFGLHSYHGTVIGAAVVATVRRFEGESWGPESARVWEQGCFRVLRLAEQSAEMLGDGPQVSFGVVESVVSASGCVAVVTVRPVRRLVYVPGDAVPVCSPRLPGRWRWLSPANAPRPDGTVEFHVSVVPGGVVSPVLVRQVVAGELLWLGPPCEVGLSLAAAGDADLLLVAGGTGLAPLRALVEQVAASPGGRRVTLVVGVRRLGGLYDAAALDELQREHGEWLTVVVVLSGDGGADPVARGSLLGSVLHHYEAGQAVLVCGPPEFVREARTWLPIGGVKPDDLHVAVTFQRGFDVDLWASRQRSVDTTAVVEAAGGEGGDRRVGDVP
ncbi:FAD-binding oxidoreductase [Micromonospora sp. HUAS LYJ1]|uniref:FAD-binding oxidoreductase n=1 Tax=Micromonospora sp. HUAS LYJ1 TaxID=3061626 RepID=UPI002673C4D1|nr:FAD-binding oxidoreductase [Micromonospora sp. HUAS LYJ1]WKU03930.1 FAD-binding oxidoreductase [Micromonospora sp. HUAS LYJ1]